MYEKKMNDIQNQMVNCNQSCTDVPIRRKKQKPKLYGNPMNKEEAKKRSSRLHFKKRGVGEKHTIGAHAEQIDGDGDTR
jgi:hypothetical protein